MADKLPWFPFYANDWVTDPRVLSLTNEQRGIFHWLLCRQWMDGDLPGDILFIYPLLPPGSDSAAVGFVLTSFFPTDPDSARRSNPRMNDIRAEQEALVSSRREGAAKTNKIKQLRRHAERSLSDTLRPRKTEVEAEREEDEDPAPANLPFPASIWTSGLPYFRDLSTRRARIGEVQMLLEGMRGARVSPEAVARGMSDMLSAKLAFTPNLLRTWCQRAVKLLEGEAGQRAAAASKPVLGHPRGNQAPSGGDAVGFAEDEVA